MVRPQIPRGKALSKKILRENKNACSDRPWAGERRRRRAERLLERVSVGGAIPPSLHRLRRALRPEWFKPGARSLNEAGVQSSCTRSRAGPHGIPSPTGCPGDLRTKSGHRGSRQGGMTAPASRHAVQAAPLRDGARATGSPSRYLMFRMASSTAWVRAVCQKNPSQGAASWPVDWCAKRRAPATWTAAEDILFFATPHEREVSVNSTRVTRSWHRCRDSPTPSA